jgi:hypothetical protein
METREYRTFTEKANWGEGPWVAEPDKVQYADPDTGLPALVVRNRFGALCGYVGVSEGHPWFGKNYDDVDADVHGGLTFAGPCQGGSEEGSICHIPSAGEPDSVWWLGFDCGHAFDLLPAQAYRMSQLRKRAGLPDSPWPTCEQEQYRDLEYVKQEIAQLAQQAREASK